MRFPQLLIWGFFMTAQVTATHSASGLPSDSQVIADATPKNKEGLISVEVTKGRAGESYFDRKDLKWYFDRGVVVKRKANIPGAENAVVVVGGLARYQEVGGKYNYWKFLTTYNEYEGIPRPSENELQQFVGKNLGKVFMSREHNIYGIEKLAIQKGAPWVWHTPNSFSVPFTAQYRHRKDNTTLEERAAIFEIRFYRNGLNDAIHALMATEKDIKPMGQTTHTMAEIEQMKTLRTGW
jgi:hypothetical protein